MDEQTKGRVARAIGRIPSGCSIITARSGDRRTGMLASWVQQAGMEPPAVSVAVKRGRPIESIIDESGAFVLNLLGENPTAMFRHFGKGFPPDADAFAGLETEEVAGGIVISDRIGWIAATVLSKVDAGDHWIYVAEVIDGEGDVEARPYVHIRKNGLGY